MEFLGAESVLCYSDRQESSLFRIGMKQNFRVSASTLIYMDLIFVTVENVLYKKIYGRSYRMSRTQEQSS